MTSWFDYGFPSQSAHATPTAFDPRVTGVPTPQQAFGVPGVAIPHPLVQPTYALQLPPAIGAYQRQPFAPVGTVGIAYSTPYGVNPMTPYGIGPVAVFGTPALQPASWPGFQEPSTLRPIGFQPQMAAAGNLSPFQQVFGRIPSDDEIENLISEALDAEPLFAGNAEVEVRCESGQVTLTGQVQQKWLKRAIGELAWNAPGIVDVQNNLELASRRRIRAGLRRENAQPAQQRK